MDSTSTTLNRFERMPRAELETIQLSRIQHQLTRLYNTSGFYRAHMDSAKIKATDIKSLADFARLPSINKQHFLEDQLQHPPFGARLSVTPEDVALISTTGGTSGQGQEIYGRTHHDATMQGYLHYLPWYLAGLRPGDTALNCVPTGGMTTGGWGPAEGFRMGGATAIHAPAALSTDGKIDLMLRFGKVNFIYSSTNYLHTLTEGFRRRGISPQDAFPMMKSLFIAGEGYPMHWAQSISEEWGCALHEGYGSTQGTGFIASTCEKSAVRKDSQPGRMHLFEWENYVEVIDPQTQQPVAEGEEGEVVLTNLSILGSPVLRFATGDRARYLPASACGCGRSWNCIEAGSVARFDDMMKIRGNNVWPATVDAVMFSHHEVAEYLGRVFVDDKGRTEVEIRYALKPSIIPPESVESFNEALSTKIKANTNVRMTLKLVARDELPTFENKARRWHDERKSGYANQT